MFFKLLVVLVFIASAQSAIDSSVCVHHDTCSSCLEAANHCSWCTDRTYDMRLTRCMTKMDLLKENCRESSILINKITKIEYTENQALHDFTREKLDAVQIQPQKVKFKLRKGRTETIKMVYRAAKNYPFDLYYLMDLTYSMRDDKETLLGVGNRLAGSLNSLSENYRIGFGSFGDKNALPFIIPGTEANPCAPEKATCKPLYSYRHSLSLTKDVNEFIKKVNASEITGNLDTTEGGMDALMQILVCPEHIGWSNRSRKIVVFATDAKQHFAGDGFLAGVVTINDKQCHLDETGEYTASLEYDYPSLEQIYRELIKMKVNVIFAVTKDLLNHYNQMNDVLDEISSVGQLAIDSSNILQLVENGYKEFAKRATFLDDSADYIKMTYRTNCGGKYENLVETSKCDNIELGKNYEFFIDVQLLEYPNDNVFNHNIRVEESSIGHEALEMDIDIDHGCACLAEEVGEANSTLCNFHGEMKCGMCMCIEGWAGKTCECNLLSYSSSKELDNECREPYTEDGETKFMPICYDKGGCLCGRCYCNVGSFGKYCSCEECPRFQGMECGGADHGLCTCTGRCECQPGWKGDGCQCTTSVKTCSAPNSDKVCLGRGSCECGKCECEPGYNGDFCEKTIGGENGLCTFYEACVQCIVSRNLGDECTEFEKLCKSKYGDTYGHSFVAQIDEERAEKCIAMVKYKDDICKYNFIYDINNHDTLLTIEDTPCPPIFMGAIGWASLAGIILLTLLLGLCGICCYVHILRAKDKREFAEFETRLAETQYEFDSPIYKSPITEYRMPQKDQNGMFELRSTPTPRSPTASYTSKGVNDRFTYTGYDASPNPKSPAITMRAPFKNSVSTEPSSNIIYQTSSVVARDITSESPTVNTSSIIFKKFPTDQSERQSKTLSPVIPLPPSATLTPVPMTRNLLRISESDPQSPKQASFTKIVDNSHQSVTKTTVIHPRPLSPLRTYSPAPSEERGPQVVTTHYVNGEEVKRPLSPLRMYSSPAPSEELGPQIITRYYVNGEEMNRPLSPTRAYSPDPDERYFRPQPSSNDHDTNITTQTITKRYFVNGQEVDSPYGGQHSPQTVTTTKTIYRSLSGEEPSVSPQIFQRFEQPQTSIRKTVVQRQIPQRAMYLEAIGDEDEEPMVLSETFIRQTVTEPGQMSPTTEKVITIRTSEPRMSPRQSDFNSFGK